MALAGVFPPFWIFNSGIIGSCPLPSAFFIFSQRPVRGQLLPSSKVHLTPELSPGEGAHGCQRLYVQRNICPPIFNSSMAHCIVQWHFVRKGVPNMPPVYYIQQRYRGWERRQTSFGNYNSLELYLGSINSDSNRPKSLGFRLNPSYTWHNIKLVAAPISTKNCIGRPYTSPGRRQLVRYNHQ